MIIDVKFPFRERMIKDNFDPRFIISNDLVQKALTFAQECSATSRRKYASRGQYDMGNIVAQNRTGKITEQAIYEKLLPYLPNLTSPDFQIYAAKQKNWNPDLTDATIDPPVTIGCKSQRYEQGLNFGVSWVCEFREGGKYDRDTGIFGEEAKKPGHFICCATINLAKRWVDLQALVAISTLHEKKLFEPMVKASLQSNKLAIYLESMKERVLSDG